jgi:hypothetical protein
VTRSARSPSDSSYCCRHHTARRFGPIRRRRSLSSVGSASFWTRSRRSSCLLIVIDQFEELQSAVAEPLRSRFVALLKVLTEHHRLRVVATLRADFLGSLSRDETLARLLSGHSFVLHPPGAAALRAIIREPARLVGVTVEDQLIDQLAEAARREPGALPILAFALERLYASREGQRLARPAAAGSTTLGAILEDYTNEVEGGLEAEQREVLRSCSAISLASKMAGIGSSSVAAVAPISATMRP